MAKLYLVCGLSGSGKTKFSIELAKELNILRVCPDEIYAIFNGTDLDRSNTFEVWQTLFLIVHTAERNNRDVIIDSDALTVQQRTQFCEWFPSFDRHMIVVETDRETRRENNRKRTRVIPEGIMDEKEKKYERPTMCEVGWKSIEFVWNERNERFVRVEG